MLYLTHVVERVFYFENKNFGLHFVFFVKSLSKRLVMRKDHCLISVTCLDFLSSLFYVLTTAPFEKNWKLNVLYEISNSQVIRTTTNNF